LAQGVLEECWRGKPDSPGIAESEVFSRENQIALSRLTDRNQAERGKKEKIESSTKAK
jgi:uncharacterized membrane-anchored protein